MLPNNANVHQVAAKPISHRLRLKTATLVQHVVRRIVALVYQALIRIRLFLMLQHQGVNGQLMVVDLRIN